MSGHKEITSEAANVGLRREIGLMSAVNFLISVIIGSGIFVTPGKVLAECGSVGMMMTVWVLCGIISFLVVLPFGELGVVVPKSGSIYIYLYTAYKHYHPFFGELPAFVFFWISFIITEPCSTALNAILFGDYSFLVLKIFLSESLLEHEFLIKTILGASAIVLMGTINVVSVKAYVRAQDWLTFTKIGAIMVTVGCGFYMYVSGNANSYKVGFEGTNFSVSHLTQAMYLGLYAYDGGYAITGITEELKNPEKNIILSVIIALIVATAAYLLLNITFLSALSLEDMANGTTVIADFAEKMFGSSGGVIAASIISICLLTAILCGTFYNSRMGFVAAREGHMIQILSCIHKTWLTPAPAVVAQILLSLLYYFVGGDITFLIDMGSFFMWLAYGFTMIGLFILRVKLPDAYRPFRVPSGIPIIVIVLSFSLVFLSISITDIRLLLAFVGCVALVIFFYYIFIYKALTVKQFDKMQAILQDRFMLVLPDEFKSSDVKINN